MVGGGHGSPPDRTDSEAEGAEIDAYVEAAREDGILPPTGEQSAQSQGSGPDWGSQGSIVSEGPIPIDENKGVPT